GHVSRPAPARGPDAGPSLWWRAGSRSPAVRAAPPPSVPATARARCRGCRCAAVSTAPKLQRIRVSFLPLRLAPPGGEADQAVQRVGVGDGERLVTGRFQLFGR